MALDAATDQHEPRAGADRKGRHLTLRRGLHERLDRAVLAEHDVLEVGLQAAQRLLVVGRDALGRDARDLGDDLLDVWHVDGQLALVLGPQHLGGADLAFDPGTGRVGRTYKSGGGFGLVADDAGHSFTTYNLDHLQQRLVPVLQVERARDVEPFAATASISDHGESAALFPVFARDILQAGPSGLGLLRAGPGIGAFAMSLMLARWPLELPVGTVLFGVLVVFGAALVVFGLSTHIALSVAALVVMGAADVVSVVIRFSLVQIETPDAMRGRSRCG